MPGFVKSLVDRFQASFPGRLVAKYGDDQGGELATILAFRALFSMFPIALSLLTILGFFLRDDRLLAQVQGAIASALPSDPGLTDTVTQALTGTRQNAGWFGLISLLGLLYGGSSLFGAMETAFNTVFRVPPRPFLQSKLMAILMIFVFAVLLLVAVVASSAATLLARFSDQLFGLFGVSVGFAPLVIGWLLSILSGFVLFLALFWIVPNRKFTFRQVLPGALLAAVAFLVVSQVFPFYASNFGNFNRYGASLGLAFLLLTWFGFIGEVLLFGAELNSVLLGVHETAAAAGTRRFREATVERPKRDAARLAALTPKPATHGHEGGLANKALPIGGAVGVLAGLYLLLGRLRKS